MNSNLLIVLILGIAFAAVGLHLIFYSRRQGIEIRQFAASQGYSYQAKDKGVLERQLGRDFGINSDGCVRTFGQVRDVVSLPNGTIFRTVELIDLNPHGAAANSHHSRTAVLFSAPSEWFGIFHITPELEVHQRYPLATDTLAESVSQFLRRLEMPPPPCPLSLTLGDGQGLAYLEPVVASSVTREHLTFLSSLAVQLSQHSAR